MKKIIPFLVSLFLTLLSLGIHMASFSDSMLNNNSSTVSNGYLTYMVNYHKELPAFSRRPLSTVLIETTAQYTGLSIGKSYILVNYSLFFFSGVLLFWLAKVITKTYKYSLMAIVAYFLTFSVFFAFFSPIYTYDEPLQYCFIFIALLGLLKQRWVQFIVFFTLAIVSRETSVLLLPGIGGYLVANTSGPFSVFHKKNAKKVGLLLIPVLCYLLYLVIFLLQKELLQDAENEMSNRFACFIENFESQKNTIESLVSLFLTLGPFLYLLWVYLKRNTPGPLEKTFINAFFITFILNTTVVVLFSFARESRLFALPLFFLWPLAGALFWKEISFMFTMKPYLAFFRNWRYAACLLLCSFLSYLFAFKGYETFYDASGENHLFHEYLFASLVCISVHFLLRNYLDTYATPEAH